MKEIILTQGKAALVDNSDYKNLFQFKWYAKKEGNAFYAARKCRCPFSGKRYTIFMHRQIISTPCGLQTDHINHDGLDNRRMNLRICTNVENQQNQAVRKNGASKFKGVTWFKRDKNWMAKIQQNGKRIYLGLFNNEIEAAKAYDTKAVDFFGEFACLNFPKPPKHFV